MTEQDIKDWLAQNQGASDTTMTQMARQNMVDPGMIARATGVPVTEVYSRMAAVPQQRQQTAPVASTPADYLKSNAYKDFQKSQEGAIGTMDVYQSPYFGHIGSGARGRAQDAAYEEWLKANPTQGTPSAAPAQNAYFAANPDVAAAYAKRFNDPNLASTVNMSPEEFAQVHYQKFGQAEQRQSPMQAAGLPSYNTFLDNLMSSMGATGGMMGGNMGFDMPALATSTYVRPTFGNLNDVRTQAEAAYKAKKAAEDAAKQAEIKQAIEQYVASGGDLGMLTGNGYNGFGPSATSYTGYSDALAAKGQTSGVPVEDRGSYSGSVSGWSGISDTNTNADTNSSSVYGQGGFL